jgi:hypothetical protein
MLAPDARTSKEMVYKSGMYLVYSCVERYDLNICLLLECHECIYHLVLPLWTIDARVPGGKWLFQDSSYKDMLPLKDKVQKSEWKLTCL